jgi:hypothetical protein
MFRSVIIYNQYNLFHDYMLGVIIAIFFFVLLSFSREGFSCSVEKCRVDQSFIKKDGLYCCFDPLGKQENVVSKQSAYSDCNVDPGKNRMTLFDSYGTPVVYDTPVSYNCNPYNVMVTKK